LARASAAIIAAKINVELARDLEVISGPRIALRVVEADAAATGDGDQRIGFGSFAVGLERLEMPCG